MKSVLEKARAALGYIRANTERITPVDSPDGRGQGVELQSSASASCSSSGGASLTTSCSTVDHVPYEGDDVLFSKNNVFLKYPIKELDGSMVGINSDFRSTSHPSDNYALGASPLPQAQNKPLDNHVLVPGFLFVTTRGSNYGTTLILNWAPNSSMRVPSPVSHGSSAVTSTRGETSYGGTTCVGHTSDQISPISIDLCLMEMIRVFYHVDDKGFISSGELVLKNKDENFKVFYFSNGGLNDLIHIFRSWTYFSHTCHKDTHCHTFTIFCPKLSLSELHPLEGKVSSFTAEVWASLKDSEGRISDEEYVLRVVFFQGVISSLRKEVWPFLLGVYPFCSSQEERERFRHAYTEKYWKIDAERRRKYLSLSEEEAQKCDTLRNQIDKDVVRTDRLVQYYKDENNTHLSILLNIILNYLNHNPGVSYVQGMSDLLAPLLYIVDDEVEAFSCFSKLMDKSSLCKPGQNQVSVRHQLELLRQLTKFLIPTFYQYLENVESGLTLMFCHRWLLVFLKREFSISDVLFIWETCWSCPETKSFHLFICIAIMAMYGQKAIDKQMNIDELMVYFNTLSLKMPREVVLSQARGYLHMFSQSATVNCALYEVMSDEFWLKRDSPRLRCATCKEFGSCSRTGYVSSKEMKC